jgi:VanZ family protein
MALNLTRIEWTFGYLLVAAALVICLLPGTELPDGFELNDKISHMVGHAALAAYFTGLVPRRNWWKVFLFFLLFGAVIEVAQHFMHMGREGDPRDVLANGAGTLIGLLVGWIGVSRWPELLTWAFRRREPVR